MTTYDYELLDPPAADLAARIRTDAAAVRTLGGYQLGAMLGWAQHQQDRAVYEPVFDEIERRSGDLDSEPCADCGLLLMLAAECYAIDCGTVCLACAVGRYGERRSEFAITSPEARAESSADRRLLDAVGELRESESALRKRITERWGLSDD